MLRPAITHAAPVALLCLAGCATTPEEAPPPPFELTLAHHLGSVRTGPMPAEAIRRADVPPFAVRLRTVLVLEGASQGLPVRAQSVFVGGGGEVLRTHSSSAGGVLRLDDSADLVAGAWEREDLAALPEGATLGWRLRSVPESELACLPDWEGFELQLARGAELEAALVFGDEHVVLRTAPEADGAALRLFVPAPLPDAPQAGLVLDLEVLGELSGASERSAASFAREVARAEANLLAAGQLARDGASGLSEVENFRFESENALRALGRQRLQRPALVFLARETGARISGDLALVAEDAALSEYLQVVRDALDDSLSTGEPAAVGWFLDSLALRWLAGIDENTERELAPELWALLLKHVGQLGSHPDLVLEVVAASEDLADFSARRIAENRIFLEDAHPSARLRAFEWLEARGAAPAGFDPLATRDQRRAALAAAEAEAEGASEDARGEQP